jgi:hypothetical protein
MADHPSRERRWRPRPWRASGMHRQLAPAELHAADRLRAELIADHMGGEPSAAQAIVLSLLASAATRHANVSRYLASLGDVAYVDKRSRKTWRVVHDLSSLEAHVGRLVALLCDPALGRTPAEALDLDEYVRRRDAAAGGVVAEADSSGAPAVDPGGTAPG